VVPSIFNRGDGVIEVMVEYVIYRELLKSSYYIKVLYVLRTISNCLGNISIGGIKEAGEYFARVR
jgi:hypothetical protein